MKATASTCGAFSSPDGTVEGGQWARPTTLEALALRPLFWSHVLPYGEVKLNMTRRLALSAAQITDPEDEDP